MWVRVVWAAQVCPALELWPHLASTLQSSPQPNPVEGSAQRCGGRLPGHSGNRAFGQSLTVLSVELHSSVCGVGLCAKLSVTSL